MTDGKKMLLIFDIDGTLTNTVDIDDKCFLQALFDLFAIKESQIDWEMIKEKSSGTDSAILNEIFLLVKSELPTQTEIDAFKKYFLTLLKKNTHHFKQIDGAENFFNILRKNRYLEIAIATGSYYDSAQIKLSEAGINYKGIEISASDDTKMRKDIISNILDKYTEDEIKAFERIIYFGDGKWDYLAAQQNNIDFIAVDINKSGELQKLGAEKVINSYKNHNEIFSLLNSL